MGSNTSTQRYPFQTVPEDVFEANVTGQWGHKNLAFPDVGAYMTLNENCQTVHWVGWEYYNTNYRHRVRYLHGWLAVAAWSFLGSIMIIANRYLSGMLWRYFFWIHAICGTLLYMINFGTCYYVWHTTSFGVAT
jgi:hypothetical protein